MRVVILLAILTGCSFEGAETIESLPGVSSAIPTRCPGYLCLPGDLCVYDEQGRDLCCEPVSSLDDATMYLPDGSLCRVRDK